MRDSTAGRIVKSGLVVIAAHVIFKCMGLVQNVILASAFKDKPGVLDAFVIAFEGVVFLIFLVGEEAVGPAFLPVFSEEKNRKSERAAWNFAASVLLAHGFLLLFAALFITVKSEWVVKLINFLSGNDFQCRGEKNLFTAALIRYMGVGLIGFSLGTTTYMILNGFKRFFWAAFGDTLAKAGIIAAVLLLYDPAVREVYHPTAVLALGLGVALGGFAKLAGHVWGMRDKLSALFRARPSLRSPAFRKFLLLIAPLLVGIVFAKVRDLVNNIFILNHISRIEGLISARSWGSKLYKTIGWFVPYGISIAMFPYFCDMVDRDDKRRMGMFLTDSSRMLLLFFFPLAAGGAVLSYPMVSLLFGHGNTEWIYWAAAANACYMLVLPFYSLEYFFLQGFFADRRMAAPIVLGVICSFISVGISYVVVIVWRVHLVYGPVFAVVGVAMGYTVSRILKIVLFVHFFRKKIPVFESRDAAFFAKLLLLTLGVAAAAFGAKELVVSAVGPAWAGRRIAVAGQTAAATAAGGAVFLLLVYILRFPEFTQAVSWALQTLKRRRGGRENGGEREGNGGKNENSPGT